jgi:hypothetical protein
MLDWDQKVILWWLMRRRRRFMAIGKPKEEVPAW